MAGVLEFTLGLEASNFLRNCGLASGGILSLASVGQGLQSVMHSVWSSIEQGAALKDLSARAGESVENLFKLQHAFRITGVGADSAAPMLLKLQKTMSGVTEDGEKTSDLFAAIGLDFDKLKTMGGPERLIAIGDALNGINKDQAAGIGAKIFGREGAGNIVQIARSMADFKQSLVDASPAAKVFQRVSDAFDKIDDTITTIKMKVGGMFAGIAEGVQPALQSLLDFLNKLDFVAFGKRIGSELELAINSIQLGTFFDYFKLGLAAVIEEGTNLLGDQLKLQLAKAFVSLTSRDLDKVAQDYVDQYMGKGKAPASDHPALDRFKAFRETLKPIGADTGTVDFISGLLGLANQFKRTVVVPGTEEKTKAVERKTTDFTDIEKMGGILGGLGRGFGTDHARQTADNTRKANEILGRIEHKIGPGSEPTNN